MHMCGAALNRQWRVKLNGWNLPRWVRPVPVMLTTLPFSLGVEQHHGTCFSPIDPRAGTSYLNVGGETPWILQPLLVFDL
jgi:hypothetical protein